MSGLMILMGILLFWSKGSSQHEFSKAIDQNQRNDVLCSIYEGRGVSQPRTSVFARDQGSDLANFDSFVECRRNFLPVRDELRPQATFLANLDELSILIAKRLASEGSGKVWHVRPVFKSKALGEKVFSAMVFRLKNAGLEVSNLVLDAPEICPDRSPMAGVLALIYDEDQQKMSIGVCDDEQVQWWFYEKN